ncbi:MAG: Crp/Fnr family transcriptional regulator [Bacillota bacterium]
MNAGSKHGGNFSGSAYHYSPWFRRGVACWEPVFEKCPQKSVRKNSIIFSQEEVNESVYFIHKGRVRLSSFDKNGNEKSIVIVSEGNIIGEVSAKERIPAIVTATAVTDCTLFYMPSDLFSQKVLASPVLSERLILELMYLVRILTGHIRDISFMDASERVVTYLFKLSNNYGLDTPQGRKITIRFTHQEMADLTGTCRVTVSKIMKSLDKSKVIKKIDGHLYILDEAYFQKIMEEVS